LPVDTINKVSFSLIHNLDWANYRSHQPRWKGHREHRVIDNETT